MNVYLRPVFKPILHSTPLVFGLLFAVGAQAQTRIEAGYAYVDGRNDAGIDSERGYKDWRTVDRGSGGAFRIRHDWSRWYVTGGVQRLNLAQRFVSRSVNCFAGSPAPPTCTEYAERFRYDERFWSYGASVGLQHQMNSNIAFWGELGVEYQRWSSSEGTRRFDGEGAPPALPTISASDSELIYKGSAGVDFGLTDSSALLIGASYSDSGYHTAVPRYPEATGSSSLLEGIVRFRQEFGGPWEGHVEYRPSSKRQYWQVGVGYRF